MPDKVGLEPHEPTSLRGIAHRAQISKEHRFQNLYQELNIELLYECWLDLNKHAASGVDKVTAQAYEQDLQANLEDLVERLKNRTYHAKLVKRCYIPKENGGERALGIPVLEDKLVQMACGKLLMAIYEQDFLPFSYGYRPHRGAQDAVVDLTFSLQYGVFGFVVEADIKGFFNHLDFEWLMKMLSLRIDDKPFLELIRKWLKAGILDTDGQILYPEEGVPQGGSVSAALANVYLHYALDLWFEKVVKTHCQGEAMMCRYADDFVCAFRFKDDAERFFRALPKRLNKFGLEVAPEKTRTLRFSRFHPSMRRRFAFLGFELYWFPDRQGVVRVMRRTARNRLQRACRSMKDWIKLHRHWPGKAFIAGLNRRLIGHYNYYGLHGNSRSLYRLYQWTIDCAFKWLNRRGGKKRSFTFKSFIRAINKLGIAKPRITEVKRFHADLA